MKKLEFLVKKVEMFEKLAVYGDRKSFLQALSQDAGISKEPNYSAVPTDSSSTESNSTPWGQHNLLVDQKKNAPSKPNMPPVAKEVQSKLNELLVAAGKIFPLDVDGLLGPRTRKALDVFKREYNLPSTVSDQELFKKVLESKPKSNRVGEDVAVPATPGPSPTSRFI